MLPRIASVSLIIPAVLALHATGCSGDGPKPVLSTSALQAVRSDSAGVEVVEYASFEVGGPPLRLASASLTLGALGSPTELSSANPFPQAIVLGSGSIVVQDHQRLMFTDRQGRLIRTAGRHGRGPGEFGQLGEICRLTGDRTLTIDSGDGRLTIWDSAGTHISTHGRPGYIPSGACDSTGRVVTATTAGGTKAPGKQLASYALVEPNGQVSRELGIHPTSVAAGFVSFEPSIVPTADGYALSDAHAFSFHILNADGTSRRVVRSREPARPMLDAEWRNMVDRAFPRSFVGDRSATAARLLALKPPVHPTFFRAIYDSHGRVWLGAHNERGHYVVFDTTGSLLGHLRLPWPRSEVAGIHGDTVVVRRRGELFEWLLSFHVVTGFAPTRMAPANR